jgi:hypothetical protein
MSLKLDVLSIRDRQKHGHLALSASIRAKGDEGAKSVHPACVAVSGQGNRSQHLDEFNGLATVNEGADHAWNRGVRPEMHQDSE